MSDESLRKAYKYKLKPTPDQEQELERVLWRCRTLYNTALEQRITAYRRCGVTLTCYEQQAALPDGKAAFPEYMEYMEYMASHRHVLPAVLTRLAKPIRRSFQAFFRRSPRAGGTGARFPALSRPQPLPVPHLQAVLQRRSTRSRLPRPL